MNNKPITIKKVFKILMAIARKPIPNKQPGDTGDGFNDPKTYSTDRVRQVHQAYMDARKPK
ncbi:MAG: hypothetical protein WA082_02555 [Candidatus Moraniibacteriota bacterium]